MKVLIPILIGLLVVGCGESAEEKIAKEVAELRATAEAKRKANPLPKPSEAKPLTKGELKKAKEELKKVIEVRIRNRVAQLEGKRVDKLTKADLEKVTALNLDSIIDRSKVLTELDRSKVLTELKELEKLTNLQRLFLQYNGLTKIPKALENLTQLEELNLNFNRLTDDVKGLEKLTKLTKLSLGSNKLTNVKDLEKLTQLRELFLLNNLDLTKDKAQITELRNALPNCKVIFNRFN